MLNYEFSVIQMPFLYILYRYPRYYENLYFLYDLYFKYINCPTIVKKTILRKVKRSNNNNNYEDVCYNEALGFSYGNHRIVHIKLYTN